jgi:hypothetical protein
VQEFVPTLAALALIVKVVDFLRYARARDLNGVLTQLCVWVAGVLVLVLVAHTDWAAAVPIGVTPLSKLGFWSLVFAGMSVGSGASIVKDTQKSLDNNDSQRLPTLVPPSTNAAVRADE